jgi:DNA-binding SARP family transcriptional activator
MVIARVRQALEPVLGEGAAARAIQFVEGRYQLDPALARRVDVDQFMAWKRTGADEQRPLAERRASWDAALALARGPYLADADEAHEWVAQQRERYRRLVQDVHAARTRAAMRAGEEVAVLDAAEANLAFDPCCEAAHLAKARALVRLGRREAARRQGEQLARSLQRRLGLPPSPETAALLRQLLVGAEVAPEAIFPV